MACFTDQFILNHVRYQFEFNKIDTPKGRIYFVVALSNQQTQYSFVMEKNKEEWRIVNAPKLPDSILHIEDRLSEVIKSNVNPGNNKI